MVEQSEGWNPSTILKGDEIQLFDGRVGEVVKVWGHVRCHAEMRGKDGKIVLVMADRDVEKILRRTAIRGRR